jgi:hypothetical protein
MNNLRKTLFAGATLVAAGISGQASALTISGITLGPGSSGNVSLQDISSESIVTTAGDTLQGAGKITALNGGTNFAAAGLELDFVYTANVAFDNGTTIIFNTGALTFYVNPVGTFDITTTSPYGTLAALQTALATSGTDFLDLLTTTVTTIAPYNVGGAPATGGFFGTGTNLGGTNPNGSGVGYMSVAAGSGTANAVFDTNSLVFNGTTSYDMLFTSTFSVPSAGTFAPFVQVQDASTFTSTFAAVPEPSILALFGIGLAGVGLRKRKLNAVATTTVA